MKIVTKYIAFDGVTHATESECRAYEAKLAHVRLVDLKIEQIEAALSGSDPDLADAIEQIGSRIGRARRERGELKRGHKGAATMEPPVSADSTERIPSETGDGSSGSDGGGRERSVIEIIESLKDAAE